MRNGAGINKASVPKQVLISIVETACDRAGLLPEARYVYIINTHKVSFRDIKVKLQQCQDNRCFKVQLLITDHQWGAVFHPFLISLF